MGQKREGGGRGRRKKSKGKKQRLNGWTGNTRWLAYLGPVNFMVGEEGVVEFGEHGDLMRVFVDFAQIFAMLFQSAGLIPPLRNPRIILPFVE